MLTRIIEEKIINSIKQIEYLSLLKGDMGVCIFFYIMGRKEKNENFSTYGDALLNKIISQMKENLKLDIETGILGLALGIDYLVKYNYIKGDINEILYEVDCIVYQEICCIMKMKKDDIQQDNTLDVLLYFIMRYKGTKSSSQKILFKRTGPYAKVRG